MEESSPPFEPSSLPPSLTTNLLSSSPSLSNFKYIITKYDETCEEHSRIHHLIPLKHSTPKLVLFIFLNIITLGLINLIIVWFPSLKQFLLYSPTSLPSATHLNIFATDNQQHIIPLCKATLPSLSSSFLKSEYSSNFPYSGEFTYFTFKLYKYIYIPSQDTFEALNCEVHSTYNKLHRLCSQGLNVDEIQHQRTIFGECDLYIEIKSFCKLLLIEFTDPFYIFQVFSVVLWMFNQYEAYATLIIVATSISLFVGTYETRANLLSVQEMAHYSCDVNVYRRNANGELDITRVQSTELVPGDLFEIQDEGLAMPCDCILLNGTVIINEAMLTGESTPIIKSNIPRIDDAFDIESEKKKFLFAGTTVIQKRSNNKEKCLALVYATGFNTAKGNLIRSILYPKQGDSKFQSDSVKYIILMACLSFVGFGISVPFLIRAGLSIREILVKSLDLITTTVPPSLPACLGIGISYALSRLKKAGTFCINRDRINIAGKVNMICFDKTGTLTEDHLDIYGYRQVRIDNNAFVFNVFESDASIYSKTAFAHYKAKRALVDRDKNKDLNEFYIECLATCHSATLVNGNLVGDPIDVKMFQASEWNLYETNNENEDNANALISTYVRPKYERDLTTKISELDEDEDEDKVFREHYELGIVRRFDFSSKLQRMSVIVKDVNDNYYKMFCKGSPEKIRELCQSETVPADFNEQLMKYTSKGFRVLALSMKMMKMNYVQSQEISRESTESNMIFLGLLIVQNKLKEATQSSIETLDAAGIKMVMATGDNILTAISVSKECKLISNDALIYSCEIDKGELVWNTIENFADDDDNDNELVLANDFGVESNNRNSNSNTNNNNNIIKTNENDSEVKERFSFTKYYPPERFSTVVGGRRSRKPSYDLLLDEINPPDNNNNNNKRNSDINETNNNNNNNTNTTDDSFNLNIETRNYPFIESNLDDYVIALTGPTFESLLKLKNKYHTTKNEKYKPYHLIFKTILRHGYVYARMSPEHKTMLVESLRQEQLTVLMCGDGANDCGALRAADIGVSLSPEEASIAAHFTSTTPDVSCLIKLLREGKASLVTSIQTFKYMMIYSVIQFCSVTLLMVNSSYLSDGQFLASDVFIIFPLAFFIAKTGAYHKLTNHQPTDSLISFPIISSILIQSFLAFAFQFGGWVFLTYKNTDTSHEDNFCSNKDETVIACRDNTVIYLVSNIQYLITAFAFSISKPFRKPIYTNILLTLFMIFAFGYSVYIILRQDAFSSKYLTLVDLDKISYTFKYWLLLITVGNFVLSYLTEKLLIPSLNKCYTRRVVRKLREKAKEVDFEYNLNQLQKMNNNEKVKRKSMLESANKNEEVLIK